MLREQVLGFLGVNVVGMDGKGQVKRIFVSLVIVVEISNGF